MPSDETLARYLAAREYLSSLSPKISESQVSELLRQIEEAELAGGAYIVPIRLLNRKQLIQYYNKMESGYKKSFAPYVLRKSKWHRLRIPTRIFNETLPKNWKSIVQHAEGLQKRGILPTS